MFCRCSLGQFRPVKDVGAEYGIEYILLIGYLVFFLLRDQRIRDLRIMHQVRQRGKIGGKVIDWNSYKVLDCGMSIFTSPLAWFARDVIIFYFNLTGSLT